MHAYVYSIRNQCTRAISSVTETSAAIVILCDDYSSMAGKTRDRQKSEKKPSDLVAMVGVSWWSFCKGYRENWNCLRAAATTGWGSYSWLD